MGICILFYNSKYMLNMDTIGKLSNRTISVKTKIIFGVCVLVTILFIVTISILLNDSTDTRILLKKCMDKLNSKETFTTLRSQPLQSLRDQPLQSLRNQPLLYKHNIKSAPGNCIPYAGCFYPSTLANPVDPYTNTRYPENETKNCDLAWRDCNAYQDCVDNRCVPKKNLLKLL